jgi:hypothetical protein
MKSFKSVIISLCIFSSVPAFAANLQGGHDGGGANLWTSSASQVKEAIQWAIDDIRSSKPNWLFYAMPYGPNFQRDDGESLSVIQCLQMPSLCKSAKQMFKDMEDGKRIYRSAWDYLKESPMELKEDGPCEAPEKDHAAGSVSAFEVGAKLCLSVSELSRTVPSGLKAQVASVLAHEMAHLMGFGESVAYQVQKGVVENFPRITRTDGTFLAYRLIGLMMNVDSALYNAASFSQADGKGIGAYLVGYAAGQVNAIGEMLPDEVNDKTIPVAKPELYQQLKNRLGDFESQLNSLGWKSSQISDAEFDQEVAKLRAEQNEASLLLEAFLGLPITRY